MYNDDYDLVFKIIDKIFNVFDYIYDKYIHDENFQTNAHQNNVNIELGKLYTIYEEDEEEDEDENIVLEKIKSVI